MENMFADMKFIYFYTVAPPKRTYTVVHVYEDGIPVVSSTHQAECQESNKVLAQFLLNIGFSPDCEVEINRNRISKKAIQGLTLLSLSQKEPE